MNLVRSLLGCRRSKYTISKISDINHRCVYIYTHTYIYTKFNCVIAESRDRVACLCLFVHPFNLLFGHFPARTNNDLFWVSLLSSLLIFMFSEGDTTRESTSRGAITTKLCSFFFFFFLSLSYPPTPPTSPRLSLLIFPSLLRRYLFTFFGGCARGLKAITEQRRKSEEIRFEINFTGEYICGAHCQDIAD